LASVLLGAAVIALLGLGEARIAAVPVSAPSGPDAALLADSPTVAVAPARPVHQDALLPVAVVTPAALPAPRATPRVLAFLDQAPQPQAPLYLRERVLLL
jgi:hypothetical protein